MVSPCTPCCIHVLPLCCVCRFIIVACDGLWKVFSSEDAAKFVLQVLTVSWLVCVRQTLSCFFFLFVCFQDKSIQLPKGIVHTYIHTYIHANSACNECTCVVYAECIGWY